MRPMSQAKTFGLFVVTALAEIVGCYLPYLWLRRNGSLLLLAPAVEAQTPALIRALRDTWRLRPSDEQPFRNPVREGLPTILP